jgi:hypothetical protein
MAAPVADEELFPEDDRSMAGVAGQLRAVS